MTEQEILAVLSGLLRDLLGDATVSLTMTSRREDVYGWDSFNYVNFLAAAEIEFGVKFGVAEVESFEDVGAIVRRIMAMLASH